MSTPEPNASKEAQALRRPNNDECIGHENSDALRAAAAIGLQAALLVHGAWLSVGAVDVSAFLQRNELAAGPRVWVFFSMLLAGLIGLGVPLVAAKTKAAEPARLLELARFFSPVPVLANLAALLNWRTWQDNDLAFVVTSAVTVALFAWTLRIAATAPAPAPLRRLIERPALKRATSAVGAMASRKYFGLSAVVAASAGYAAYIGYYTVLYHLNGYTSSFDLGIEENIVWQALHGGPLFKSSPIFGPEGTHFGRHATFIAYVVAPFYAIHPHASTLLVLEAVVVGAAAVPLYLFAERRIGQLPAVLVALSYLLHPGVHGAQLYDFHFLTLTPFFLWFLVLAIDRRWILTAVVFTILTLSMREDVAAGLATLGCFLALSGEAARAGSILAIVGTAYFAIMKFKIMPEVEGPAFLWVFNGLLPPGTDKPSGIIKTIVANPVFAFGTLLTKHKLVYSIQMLLPVGFLPARKIVAALLLLPALVFTLLVTQENEDVAPGAVQLSFQYTMHWIPYVYVGAVWVLGTLRASHRFRPALVGMVLGTLLMSYQFGAILQQNTARAGFDPFRFGTSPDRIELRRARDRLIDMIPPDAAVAASEREVPHLSNRDNAYGLRAGIFDAEWILFSWGLPESRGDDQARVKQVLRNRSFGVVEIAKPYVLLRRGADPARNRDVLLRFRKPVRRR